MLVFVLSLLQFLCLEATGHTVGTYTVATFNADLIPSPEILGYQERRAALLQELGNSKADVLCLQGLWLDPDIKAVIQSATNYFPYYHRLPAFTETSGFDASSVLLAPCHFAKMLALQACLKGKTCPTAGVSGSGDLLDTVSCAFAQCKAEVLSLTQECVNCILANAAKGLEGLQQCAFNSLVSYPSTHGLLLLSKVQLANKFQGNFSNNELTLFTRGYIGADAQGIGTIVCTQLTGYIPGMYVGPDSFSSYEEEQTEQVDVLVRTFQSRRSQTVLILGDFGHGPQIGHSIIGSFSQQYQKMKEEGYISPFVRDVGDCTLCTHNPLAQGVRDLLASLLKNSSLSNAAVGGAIGLLNQTGTINLNITLNINITSNISQSNISGGISTVAGFVSGLLVDHVYVQQEHALEVIQSQRFWDLPIVNVSNTLVPLSDHYGVQITFKSPSTAPSLAPSSAMGLHSLLATFAAIAFNCFMTALFFISI